jgi:hydrogenase maturation factor
MCLSTTGVITTIRDDDGIPMALVDTGDVAQAGAGVVTACLLTCTEASVGDTVLVHTGYVLRIFDPQEDLP